MYMLQMAVLLATAAGDPTAAGVWRVDDIVRVADEGEFPNVFGDTVAYLDRPGGDVMFHDGDSNGVVYAASLPNWEPVNTGDSVLWRATLPNGAGVDVLRWDRASNSIVNLTESTATDSELDKAANGDVVWTESHQWLMLYSAASAGVAPLGIEGDFPAVYSDADGNLRLAWQVPGGGNVLLSTPDGVITLGSGAPFGAQPSVGGELVAWVDSAGSSDFLRADIQVYADGGVTILADDSARPVLDGQPRVGDGFVVWVRHIRGLFEMPDVYIWDGIDSYNLLYEGARYVSVDQNAIAWESAEGIFRGRIHKVIPGDCNGDDIANLADAAGFTACLGGPGAHTSANCACADVDYDGHIDLADFAAFQRSVTP